MTPSTESTAPTVGSFEVAVREPGNLVVQTFRRVLRYPGGLFGVTLVTFLIVLAVLAPIISPFDPLEIGAGGALTGPSGDNLLGTDNLGRDVLSRLMHGARLSVRVSVLSAIAALLMATPFGLVAGFIGGTVDSAISRFFDTVFAFPGVLIGVALAAIVGGGTASVVLAVGIISIPGLGRLVRVSVQAQSAEDYVLAAKSLGASQSRIIMRHILPNVFPGLLVQVTLIMASAVLLEAEFSFLGLGSKPPEPSWGIMLNEGRNYLSQAPWLGVFAGMAITIFILGFNAFGDALQKALNPRLINR